MRAPIIGLSAYSEPAQWAVWQAPAALLPMNYIDQVTEAGGVPVLLPPVPGVASALGRLDGLILTGGGDVDPAGYGAQADPRTSRVQPDRDQAELELLAGALAEGLPVLGICRGMQVLNVARGGTLCQHLPDEAGHRPAPGTFGSHRVRLAPGSRLASVLWPGGRQPGGGQPGGGQPGGGQPGGGQPGGQRVSGQSGGGQPGGEDGLTLDVATAHHQGIDRLGDGLVPVAWAQDGLIEAVELAGPHPFALGVQWHPEAGQDGRLVSALVVAAANGRAHGSALIATA